MSPSVFTHIYTTFSFFGCGFLRLYSTRMFPQPLGGSVHVVPASVQDRYQSCAERLLFIFYLLFLLIISRLHPADHQSSIPHILTGDSRVFVAVSCCPQELLLHACHIVKLGITCLFYVLHLILNQPKHYSNKHFTGFSEQGQLLQPFATRWRQKLEVRELQRHQVLSRDGSFCFPTQRCMMLTSCY